MLARRRGSASAAEAIEALETEEALPEPEFVGGTKGCLPAQPAKKRTSAGTAQRMPVPKSPVRSRRATDFMNCPLFRRGMPSMPQVFSRHLLENNGALPGHALGSARAVDRKSTRLNSSHLVISYAVFCLKKKKYHSTVLVKP